MKVIELPPITCEDCHGHGQHLDAEGTAYQCDSCGGSGAIIPLELPSN